MTQQNGEAMTQTTPPQLSDEAWQFIKDLNHRTDEEETMGTVSFDGDWGNWNWLFSEIWKRCKHV